MLAWLSTPLFVLTWPASLFFATRCNENRTLVSKYFEPFVLCKIFGKLSALRASTSRVCVFFNNHNINSTRRHTEGHK